MVRRTHGHDVHPVCGGPPTQELQVAVEALEFAEERRVGEEGVQYADGVMRVTGCDKTIARVANCPKVPRRHVAGNPSESEDGHGIVRERLRAGEGVSTSMSR
jgi:hypothetical protein